ncbi:DUF167 family protein [Pseudovibrio sp. SPO723]|uniref:DUF167 family protein n=1 Tax=Nesiotobacter zosterae TaxID=392721 RepID=UPI0029C513F9|nr:DUF167 family protein [Pseudovibrio sp. SPO723]MDX5594921.1 DUF167 family protein [Pseudovibrio sp. SPO723]
MAPKDLPWTPTDGGLFIKVRLTPKSSKDAVEGFLQQSDGKVFLAAKVRAVPEKGAANKALEQLLAKSLKTPKSFVHVEAGTTSRFKTLRVEGDAGEIEAALKRLLKL